MNSFCLFQAHWKDILVEKTGGSMHRSYLMTACIVCIAAGIFFMTSFPGFSMDEPRFVKLDAQGRTLAGEAELWAMVLDNETGLMWEVKTVDGTIHDKEAGYNWSGAHEEFIAELNRMKFGGFTDWRLPTTDELGGIKVKGPEPYIDQEFFLHTVPTSYMSWRKCGSGKIFDERVKFGEIRNSKSNRQVRAVRGGKVMQADETK